MKNPFARLVAAGVAVALALGLSACGDDGDDGDEIENAPVMTNEFGVETFEPGDDPFGLPETVQPE